MPNEEINSMGKIDDVLAKIKDEEVVQRILKWAVDKYKITGVQIQTSSGGSVGTSPAGSGGTSGANIAKYPNVIDVHGEDINILKLAGDNSAEKIRNLTLIYLWVKQQLSIKEVPKAELIAQCKHHECFDDKNFKTRLKEASGIALSGSKMKWSAHLTKPGLDMAVKLLESLNAEE